MALKCVRFLFFFVPNFNFPVTDLGVQWKCFLSPHSVSGSAHGLTVLYSPPLFYLQLAGLMFPTSIKGHLEFCCPFPSARAGDIFSPKS